MKSEKKKERCGKKTQVYSRVVGYIRPVCNWNDAKQEEFVERKTYRVEDASDKES